MEKNWNKIFLSILFFKLSHSLKHNEIQRLHTTQSLSFLRQTFKIAPATESMLLIFPIVPEQHLERCAY